MRFFLLFLTLFPLAMSAQESKHRRVNVKLGMGVQYWHTRSSLVDGHPYSNGIYSLYSTSALQRLLRVSRSGNFVYGTTIRPSAVPFVELDYQIAKNDPTRRLSFQLSVFEKSELNSQVAFDATTADSYTIRLQAFGLLTKYSKSVKSYKMFGNVRMDLFLNAGLRGLMNFEPAGLRYQAPDNYTARYETTYIIESDKGASSDTVTISRFTFDKKLNLRAEVGVELNFYRMLPGSDIRGRAIDVGAYYGLGFFDYAVMSTQVVVNSGEPMYMYVHSKSSALTFYVSYSLLK